jgi:hypothetical protein
MPQFFCPFFLIRHWVGVGMRAANGGTSDEPSQFFTCVLANDERSDEGEGDTDRPTHHRDIHHARSYSIKYNFLRYPGLSQSFYARFGRVTSDPTRGRGNQAHITPSPQAAITIKAPITRTPTPFLKNPELATGLKTRPPPPRARQSPPPMFVCSVISECLFEVHYEVRC